jgi:hypothetical protein
LIGALQAKASAICREQVAHTARRMGGLTPQQKCALEVMGQAMIGKLLHDPIEFLHSNCRTSPDSCQSEMEDLFKRMFGLS